MKIFVGFLTLELAIDFEQIFRFILISDNLFVEVFGLDSLLEVLFAIEGARRYETISIITTRQQGNIGWECVFTLAHHDVSHFQI